MSRLQRWLRKWLEIDKQERSLDEVYRALDRSMVRVDAGGRRTESPPANPAATDYSNTLAQVIELNQKFDALAELLGVVIVCNFNDFPPSAVVQSCSENGMLGDAQRYVNAALTADKFMGLQWRLFDEQRRAFAELSQELKRSRGKGTT